MSRRIPDAEATAFPWWAILDPEQMMRLDVDRLASMVTGPFFSRESATAYLRARRYAFGKHAVVYCLSGHDSDDWRAFCAEPLPAPASPADPMPVAGNPADAGPSTVAPSEAGAVEGGGGR
jgi:hypothetical protein